MTPNQFFQSISKITSEWEGDQMPAIMVSLKNGDAYDFTVWETFKDDNLLRGKVVAANESGLAPTWLYVDIGEITVVCQIPDANK